MIFVTIEPAKMRWTEVEADDLHDLYAQLGLGSDVDHGVVAPPGIAPTGEGIMIVVGGASLFEPANRQRYFSIGRRLYGGNALLYGVDEAGETVDLHCVPPVIFMSLLGVEAAIANGQIERPTMALNGVVFWEWPASSPYAGYPE